MKKIKGDIKNIKNTIYGSFTYKNNPFKQNRIVKCSKIPLFTFGAKGFIVTKEIKYIPKNVPVLISDEKINFEENDIISLTPAGDCVCVWETNSPHNGLYVTDLCNSKCIMCPQIENGTSRYDECLKILDNIDLKNCESIGITGGEPTLEPDKLAALLHKISKLSKNQKVHILTNGRNFSNEDNAIKFSNLKNIDISWGIPLYSNISEEHDYIVGIKGAFKETMQGLYNLAKHRQKIEIRIVIMRQNYKILKDIAQYIYRNLPFITHVALMALEYHGRAEENYDIISIDPVEYKEELYSAIKIFVRYNIPADVYNLPLCLADNRIHEFCKDSISTWKKTYTEKCKNCTKKDICSGVFETSFVQSGNITPYI